MNIPGILYSSRAFPLLPDYFGRGGERRVRVAGSEKGTFPSSSSLALPISPSSSSSLDRHAQRGSSMGGGKRGASYLPVWPPSSLTYSVSREPSRCIPLPPFPPFSRRRIRTFLILRMYLASSVHSSLHTADESVEVNVWQEGEIKEERADDRLHHFSPSPPPSLNSVSSCRELEKVGKMQMRERCGKGEE